MASLLELNTESYEQMWFIASNKKLSVLTSFLI